MNSHAKLFCWAVAISLAGSMPPGTLNLSVVNYMVNRNLPGAIVFSVTAIVVEVLLVRVSLSAVKKLEGLKPYYRLFGGITFVVLLLLAVNTLIPPAHAGHLLTGTLSFAGLPPLLAGIILSTINPLQLPFWIGWATALKSRKILEERASSYNTFLAAIGMGTALAFIAYGATGSYLIDFFEQRRQALSLIMGVTLLLAALWQLYNTILKCKKYPAL
ncbi:LysE family transporter [Chitinophaga arvensicola]|uniref:LysE type translocator n=1 Tax=Chitinophaga arvensicola TaxID=29529 RepID=A0A1I0SE43_9BACT|nr:LysE family transporter [Chitinophaga arvensicola]SEW57225.1 LysE type translocator [Chitinophaga arvensicola]